MTRALGDHMLKMPARDLDQSWTKHITRSFARLWQWWYEWYETLTTDVLPDAAQWCGQQRAGHHLHGCHEAGLMSVVPSCLDMGWDLDYREQDLGSGLREIPQITHPLYVYTIVYIYKFLKCTVPHSVYVLQYVYYIVSFLLPLHYLASSAADLWFSSSQTDA